MEDTNYTSLGSIYTRVFPYQCDILMHTSPHVMFLLSSMGMGSYIYGPGVILPVLPTPWNMRVLSNFPYTTESAAFTLYNTIPTSDSLSKD